MLTGRSLDCFKTEIPQEELNSPLVVAAVTAALVSSQSFDTERYKNRPHAYEFYISLVGIVSNIFQRKSCKIQRPLTVVDLEAAELCCLRLRMELTRQNFEKGTLKFLRPQIDATGIIVLGSRAVEDLKVHFDHELLPILTYGDPLSYLWMKKVHAENHTGITSC